MELWRRNPAYSTWNIEDWHTAQWHTAHVLRGSVRFQPRPHYSGQSVSPPGSWSAAEKITLSKDSTIMHCTQRMHCNSKLNQVPSFRSVHAIVYAALLDVEAHWTVILKRIQMCAKYRVAVWCTGAASAGAG